MQVHQFGCRDILKSASKQGPSAAGVFAGVTAYTWHDVNFTAVGYVWILIWYTFAVFEMVYVKKVVDTVKMTTWSRTYYQVRCDALRRVCACPPPP